MRRDDPAARAVHEQDRRSADLYAALRESGGHIREGQLLLAQTYIDQPRETLDRLVSEAMERATVASKIAETALFTAETRVDLDGREDVTVLADARTRLRAVGRRM